MAEEDQKAQEVVADIEKSERELLDVYQKYLAGPICYQHFYLFGIARRALALSAAFRKMIDDRNSLVASSIVRMQLDTVLRLYALFWVENPEEFAVKVFNGAQINKLKAKDGQLLTDKYLKDRLVARNEWMPAVYAETSGYIHFSYRHMKAAVKMVDSETHRAELQIGPKDLGKSLGYYGELLRAFRHLNMMIPVAAEDWLSRLRENGTPLDIANIERE